MDLHYCHRLLNYEKNVISTPVKWVKNVEKQRHVGPAKVGFAGRCFPSKSNELPL